MVGGLEEDGADGSLESSIRYLIYCPCVAYMERSSNFVEKCTTGGGEQRMLWFPCIGLYVCPVKAPEDDKLILQCNVIYKSLAINQTVELDGNSISRTIRTL